MKFDYSNARIRDVRLGPRRELTLEVDLPGRDNTATDGSGISKVRVRFAGIENYEDLVTRLTSDEELHRLSDSPESKTHRRVIDLEFDRAAERIRIVAQHVDEELLAKH